MPGKIRVRPGGTVRLANPDQVSELRLADIYPSALATFQLEMTLVQSRTGVNDITSPQPSPALGTRTPGVTALAFVQAANRRFAAAFSSARLALGRAIIQCHIRQQERIRMGDAKLRQKINDVMGDPASAQRVIEILRSPTFDDMLSLELTVSSASINREVDQQNSILLANILSQYYERILQLMTVASSPETPEAVRETAKRIIRAAAEMVDRTIRTFDNTRDPRNFIVEVDDVLEADKRPTDGIETPAGELFAKLLGGAPQSNETIQ